MSAQKLISRSNLIQQGVQELYTSQYYTLAGITLLYYDHILTLPLELRHIWRSKFSLVHILFLLNRYSVFFGYFVFIFFQFDSPKDDTPCADFTWFAGSLVCLTQAIIALIFTLRCYALYRRKVWTLLCVGTAGIGTVATSAWTMTDVQTLNLSFGEATVFQSCVFIGLTRSTGYLTTWTSSLAFDLLVGFLTFWKTYRLSRDQRKVGISSGLIDLLMRDGVIYFLVLATVNVFNLISVVESSLWAGTYAQMGTGNNSVLTHTISATMISRLVLNLIEVNTIGGNGTSEGTSTSLSGWAAYIGSRSPSDRLPEIAETAITNSGSRSIYEDLRS